MTTRNKIFFGLLIFVLAAGIITAVFYFKIQPATDKPVLEKIMYGKLAELTDNSLKIKILVPSNDGNGSTSQAIETTTLYKIDKLTKFVSYSDQTKSDDVYNQEMAEFNQKIKQLQAERKNIIGMEPPSLYSLQNINKIDLKIGETISLYINREQINNPEAIISEVIREKTVGTDLALTNLPYQEKITGKIQAITANQLTLLSNPINQGVVSTDKPVLREFILNDEIKIFKQRQKSTEQYLDEQNKFNKKIKDYMDSGKPIVGLEPPNLETKEVINLSDIKTGQNALITIGIDSSKISLLEISLLVD